mgnify:FL=1
MERNGPKFWKFYISIFIGSVPFFHNPATNSNFGFYFDIDLNKLIARSKERDIVEQLQKATHFPSIIHLLSFQK